MEFATTIYYKGSSIAAPATDGARILMVEDNPAEAAMVRALLEQNGVTKMEVLHCTRVSDAVTRLHDEKFQLVMLDLGLPDSQGLETLTRIQVAAKLVPILVLTGQEDLELSRNAIRLGAQECLCKSHVSGQMLVRMIGNAVERQQILAAVTARSLTDDLTGLYNRRGFLTVSPSLLKAARRLQTPLVLLYADLDGLKNINDTMGHEVGDQAIREAADVLRESFRDSDVLSRLGGDEFAVLALGVSGNNCGLLRERVQNAASARNAQAGRSYRLSLSLGAVELDSKFPVSLESLLHEADRRMYKRKRSKQRRDVEEVGHLM